MQAFWQQLVSSIFEHVVGRPDFWLTSGLFLMGYGYWREKRADKEDNVAEGVFFVGGFCIFASAVVYWLSRIAEQLS
jgi:hypothetical protein